MNVDTITLCRQIHPDQCQAITDLGFKSLINLRCDGECADQPSSAELQQHATACGLIYHHLPVDADVCLSKDAVTAFAKLVSNLPEPILVFCATGGRAKRLYQSAVVSRLI
ncbi:hypothetical protein LU293_06105 [Moraxella nasovis]|uniref:beta-lactamase hydrolase domain-containing protein n=1 Tax=Moraxella nasovis TaxID=2904121 RepID=UPI001F614856|nr:sulfur transferase domain-containing protein [Moraxella nasovis]UNU72688.1 hypothetical protein LU293_06105 [Moraxella nasovis]